MYTNKWIHTFQNSGKMAVNFTNPQIMDYINLHQGQEAGAKNKNNRKGEYKDKRASRRIRVGGSGYTKNCGGCGSYNNNGRGGHGVRGGSGGRSGCVCGQVSGRHNNYRIPKPDYLCTFHNGDHIWRQCVFNTKANYYPDYS